MKLDINLDKQLPVLTELTALFAPYQIMLVGGAVRDAILGVDSDDLDFATSALPTESEAILRGWGDQFWDPGASYGTVCAMKDGVRVEVTTFRKDTYDPDSRKPEVEFGDNIWDDLQRRDFRVNAMAIEVRDGQLGLYTLPGALEDIVTQQLNTPLDPVRSFADDPLRVIRAARFASQLQFNVDEETFNAMADTPLDKVSEERIVAELDKLLTTKRPYMGASLLEATDVLEKIIPGHLEAFYWLEDVPPKLELRWASLLLPLGPVKAGEALKKLKHSGHIFRTVPRLIALIEQWRARGNQWDAAQVRKFWWDAGDLIVDVMNIVNAIEDTNRFWYNRPPLEDISTLTQPLTGEDIMDWLNIKPGPLVGRAMKYLQNRRLEYGPMSIFEAYRELSLWWAGKR